MTKPRLKWISLIAFSVGICLFLAAGRVQEFTMRYLSRIPHKLQGVWLQPSNPFNADSIKPCENVLHNMTVGSWMPLPQLDYKSPYYDAVYREHRQRIGSREQLWLESGKCGRLNKLPKMPASQWPELTSWCDPDSDKPCCDDETNGTCAKPSAPTCDCPKDCRIVQYNLCRCVDVRRYHHAEVSTWKTDDESCAWRNYSTGTEACDVIERSPYDSLHFVGDSLIRNMFYALLMILTDDPVKGCWSRNMDARIKPNCRAERMFFFGCREVIRSLGDLESPEKLCGGRKPNFTVEALIPQGEDPKPYRDIAQRLAGREGSVIFLHIGLHLALQASAVIQNFLKPMLGIREKYYQAHSVSATASAKWPKIYFVPPLLPGLRKPNIFAVSQGLEASTSFATQMEEFCELNDVTFFDVRPFSKHVHSFDGTHYGMAVNLMKNQLMLNHFNELIS